MNLWPPPACAGSALSLSYLPVVGRPRHDPWTSRLSPSVRLHYLPMNSCDFLVLGFPERELLEGLPQISRDGLRGERRRLVSEIALDEQVLANALQAAGGRGVPQRILVRHRAHHERGDIVGVAEADTGFMCGMSRLNELLCEGEIVADDDVDVLVVGALGFLCLAHVCNTTPGSFLCQGKNGAPDGIRTRMRTFRES